MDKQHKIIIGADMGQLRKEADTAGSVMKGIVGADIVERLAQFGQELFQIGIEAQRAAKAFNAIGGTEELMTRLKTATGGLASNLEIMANASNAMAKGINSANLDEMAAFATKFSEITGQQFETIHMRLETALLNPTREAFNQLGIDFNLYNELVMGGMNKQEAAASALVVALDKLPAAAGGAATAMEIMATKWENWKASTGEWLANQAAGFIASLHVIGRMMTNLGDFFRGMSPTQYMLMVQEELNKMYAPINVTADNVVGGGTDETKKPGGGATRHVRELYDYASEWFALHSKVILQWEVEEMRIKAVEDAMRDLQEVTLEQEEAYENLDESSARFFENFALAQDILQQVGNSFAQMFEAAMFSGEDFFFTMEQWFMNFTKRVLAAAAAALLLSAILGGIGVGGSAFSTMAIFKNLLGIGGIPQLAEGGIVTRPTLALIGEAGPEAVVPLRGSSGFGGMEVSTVRVEGSDLILAIQRAGYNQSRTSTAL